MKRRSGELVLFFLVAVVLCGLFLRPSHSDNIGSERDTPEDHSSSLNPTSQRGINVAVWVSLPNRYEFYNLDVQEEISVEISVNFTDPPSSEYSLTLAMMFSLVGITGLPESATASFGFYGTPPIGVLRIDDLPANVSYSSFRLTGFLSGRSVLWRNISEVFFLNVTSPVIDVSLYELAQRSYRVIFSLPTSCRFLRVYSFNYPDLPFETVAFDDQEYIVVSKVVPASPVVIMYEFEEREPTTVLMMFTLIAAVFIVPLIMPRLKGRRRFQNSLSLLRRNLPRAIKFNPIDLLHKLLRIKAVTLLRVYVLCSLLMISISFLAGPDPRPKIYVLAATPESASRISNPFREEGASVITVIEELGEFKTLADLGVFSAAVIGDFVPPTKSLLDTNIYPALDVVPRIFILQSFVMKRNQSLDFSQEVYDRYSGKTLLIDDLDSLESVFPLTTTRSNSLGLKVSLGVFSVMASVVGLLSLVIVFFGVAFIASNLVRIGKEPRTTGIAEGIAYAFLYFFFTEAIYIACSVLLAMPLGLHTSTSKVTAIGFLGLGGGSRPRMLMAIAGFLLGAITSMKDGPKVDKMGFAATFVIGLFILIDPLTSGLIFYEFVLLFATDLGPIFEASLAGWSYIRAFLYGIGNAFGGWVSRSYGISSGIMLYFAGAIPFCLYSKLRKSTATLLLFFSAFCVAQGGIRVADMIALKAIASSIPGIVTGFLVAGVFALISFSEAIIRTRISRRQNT